MEVRDTLSLGQGFYPFFGFIYGDYLYYATNASTIHQIDLFLFQQINVFNLSYIIPRYQMGGYALSHYNDGIVYLTGQNGLIKFSLSTQEASQVLVPNYTPLYAYVPPFNPSLIYVGSSLQNKPSYVYVLSQSPFALVQSINLGNYSWSFALAGYQNNIIDVFTTYAALQVNISSSSIIKVVPTNTNADQLSELACFSESLKLGFILSGTTWTLWDLRNLNNEGGIPSKYQTQTINDAHGCFIIERIRLAFLTIISSSVPEIVVVSF